MIDTNEVYEVMVDAFGHAAELMRGDVVTAHDVVYDLDELERASIVRRLRPEEAARLVETGARSTTAATDWPVDGWSERDATRATAREIAATLAAR